MNRETFTYTTRMPAGVEQVFQWHERLGAFERLGPPWVKMEVLEKIGAGITDGVTVKMLVSYGPINTTWTVQHKDYIKNAQFCDFQVDGPLAFFEQRHRFVPESDAASLLEDQITYQLPSGIAGETVANMVMQDELTRWFRYRHEIVEGDLRIASRYNKENSMKIAVTGSTGFVGSALVPFLTTQGHNVRRLVRPQSRKAGVEVGETATWDPDKKELDVSALEGCDALVNLVGDNIGTGRWDEAKKQRMQASRWKSTHLLCDRLRHMKDPPKVFVNASAIGFYGDSGSQVMTEQSPRGSGFLAELCDTWEVTASNAEFAKVRTIYLRIGVVLSPAGGALQKMLVPFQMGAGGPIGSGEQYFSWIALDDVLGAVLHCLVTDSLSGPVNCVAPNPVTNAQYTRALGHVLQRPAFMPMPAFAARMAFGQFADECLLSSTRVAPEKLLQCGYQFRYPELEGALRHVLGKTPAPAKG